MAVIRALPDQEAALEFRRAAAGLPVRKPCGFDRQKQVCELVIRIPVTLP